MSKKNREALIGIMDQFRVGAADVADILNINRRTVYQYCTFSGLDINDKNLELLRYKLEEKYPHEKQQQ